MWLSLFLLIFLAAIAYFHAIQGLFSALISAMLCLLCAALAFATFEYMAINVLADFKPDFAMGLALAGMFAVPLLILRTLLDKAIHRGCMLPVMLDRVGGLAFGALASFIMVGVLAVSLQLMPFGSGFLGFARVDRNPEVTEENELWLSPDRFAVKVASMLSAGVFSGSEPFAKVHPDFVTEIGWIEAVMPTDQADRRHVRRFAPPESLSVMGAWEEPYTYTKTSGGRREELPQYDARSAEPGNRYIRAQLRLTNEAQDPDNQQRFTLYQVRLVGEEDEDARQYHAIGVADSEQVTADAPPRPITELRGQGDVPLMHRLYGASGNVVDVVFEVPKSFKPRFVAYKAGARQPITLGQAASGAGSATVSTSAGPSTSGGTPTESTGGAPPNRVSGVAMTGSFFGDSFPAGMVLTRYRRDDAEIDSASQGLRQGHVHGDVQAQSRAGGSGMPLSKFVVPPEKRLLHLSVQKLQPGSMLGKALDLAVTTMKNYVLVDSLGREYLPVGAYAISKLGAATYFEIQYYPEYAETTGRGLRPWAKLKEQRFTPDDTYVLLYLVEPGAKMKSFRTGGGSARAVDLEDKDLTAPQ